MRDQKRQIKISALYSDFLESQLEQAQSYSNQQESMIDRNNLNEKEIRLLSDRFEKGLTFEEIAKSRGAPVIGFILMFGGAKGLNPKVLIS